MNVKQITAWQASDGSIYPSQTLAELHEIKIAKYQFESLIDNAIDFNEETIDYEYIAENILVLLQHALKFTTETIIPLDDYYKCVNECINRNENQ